MRLVIIKLESGAELVMRIIDSDATVLGEISKLIENRAKAIEEGVIINDPIISWEEINE